MQRYLPVIALAAACGGGTSPVRISSQETWITPTGAVTQAVYGDAQFYAYVDGARYPATGYVTMNTDGTAEIDDVPDGEFELVSLYQAAISSVDVRTDHDVAYHSTAYGRRGAPVGDTGTTLELQVANLAPYGADDSIDLVVPETGENPLDGATTGQPTAGATAYDATWPWSSQLVTATPPPLLDPAEGDAVVLGHVARTQLADGSSLGLLAQVATLSPTAAQVSGANTVLAGAFDSTTSLAVQLHADVGAAFPAFPIAGTSPYWDMHAMAGIQTSDGWEAGLHLITFSGSGATGVFDSGPQVVHAADPAWQPVLFEYAGEAIEYPDGFWGGESVLTQQALGATNALETAAPMPTALTVFGSDPRGVTLDWNGTDDVPIDVTIDGDSTWREITVMDVTNRTSPPYTVSAFYVDLEAGTSALVPAAAFTRGHRYVLTAIASKTDDTSYGLASSRIDFGEVTMGR